MDALKGALTSDEITAATSGEAILERLAAKDDISELPDEVQKLIKQHRGAASPQDKEAAGGALLQYAETQGTVSKKETAGGWYEATTVNDWLKKKFELTGALEKDASKTFPNVTLFDEATKRLNEAAIALAKRAERPTLPTGDN